MKTTKLNASRIFISVHSPYKFDVSPFTLTTLTQVVNCHGSPDQEAICEFSWKDRNEVAKLFHYHQN